MSRPKTLDEFQGQSNRDVIDRLRIAIVSAKERRVALPHILFYGSAGLGKTTLSNIVANEMDSKCIVRTGGSIASQSDLFSVLYEVDTLQRQGDNALLFFDEIHKLSVSGMPEEIFYSLLEEFIFHSTLAGTKTTLNGVEGTIENDTLITTKPFTIIGATTSPGSLKKPLRDRFAIHCYLKPYSVEDLVKVLSFNLNQEKIQASNEALHELARRARGVPRVVINYLLSCRDRAIYKHEKEISKETVDEEMTLQGVEYDGLTQLDVKILQVLARNPKGMGLKTLAGTCSIDNATLEEMVLPFLQAQEFVKTTTKRFITESGIARLKEIK